MSLRRPVLQRSVALPAHVPPRVLTAAAELRVHFEEGVWKAYEDTAKEHPMSPVIAAIVKAYKTIGAKTLVMPARSVLTLRLEGCSSPFASQHRDCERGLSAQCSGSLHGDRLTAPCQVVALVSLGPDHLTLSGGVLDRLAALPPSQELTTPLANSINAALDDQGKCIDRACCSCAHHVNFYAELAADYIKAGGDALRVALAKDIEATRKLAEALSIFDQKEQQTKVLIRGILSA